MNIKIVLEGKLKESFYKDGVAEYAKRLLGRVQVIETSSILNYISNKQTSFIVSLEIEGKQLSSEELANKISSIENDGLFNEIIFLIGGANGLSDDVKSKSNFKLSMSKFTFLHQESVLILVEQIYRAYSILNNTKYHK